LFRSTEPSLITVIKRFIEQNKHGEFHLYVSSTNLVNSGQRRRRRSLDWDRQSQQKFQLEQRRILKEISGGGNDPEVVGDLKKGDDWLLDE
jgi:hypothetical protein